MMLRDMTLDVGFCVADRQGRASAYIRLNIQGIYHLAGTYTFVFRKPPVLRPCLLEVCHMALQIGMTAGAGSKLKF